MFFGIPYTTVLANSEKISIERKEVQGKIVNIVTVDFNSPDITFDVVKGNDQLVGWEEFKSIIERTKPAAAINGNFFNAYATEENEIVPWGYIYKNGK